RRPTATSAFGVSKREGHDSSAFYERFMPPEISDDATVNEPKVVDEIVVGDSRNMTDVADSSVALVVTSPPYFAGKEYETALGEGGWRRAVGASGSCAGGSFRSPTNPTLRDLTERVVIASKGRFDRAHGGEPTIGADEFMEATLDVWDLPAESAQRVGHPAPF